MVTRTKKQLADDVIDNSGDAESWKEQIPHLL